MCGLSGYVFGPTNKRPHSDVITMFTQLYVMSQLRGFDSSGLAVLWHQQPKSNKKLPRWGWVVNKELQSPYEVLLKSSADVGKKAAQGKQKKQYEDIPYVRAALGHARAATIGDVTKDNAHPFQFGNKRFVGTHNGTISNATQVYNTLKKKEPLPDTTEPPQDYSNKKTEATDSEIVLYCIYRWGIKEVYPLIKGAWAIVWWDERDKSINFVRNHARTLYYSWASSDDALFWSSELGMLELAHKRQTTMKSNWTNSRYRLFPVDTHFKVSLNRHITVNYNDVDYPWDSEESLAVPVKKYQPSFHCYQGFPAVNGEPSPNKNTLPKGHVEMLEFVYSPFYKRPVPVGVHETAVRAQAAKQNKTTPVVIDTDACTCLWCDSVLNKDNLEDSLVVKGQGTVCGDCATDLWIVAEVTTMYNSTIEDDNWIERYLELCDERDSVGYV